MKWFKNLFKKRNVKLGFTLVTAGTDIEGRQEERVFDDAFIRKFREANKIE